MVRSRLFRGVGVTTFLLGVGAATALACSEPNLVLGESQAGAGDIVSYSVSGTDQGASYTLSVDGTGVGSGTDSTAAPGTSGSFTMPDLGNTPHSAYVRLLTTHEGNEWASYQPIQYTVPAPAGTPSGFAGAPSLSKAGSEKSKAGSEKASRTSHPRSRSRSDGDTGNGLAASPPGVAGAGSPTVQTRSASTRDSSAAGEQAAVAAAAGSARRSAATVVGSQPFDVPAGFAIPGYFLLALAMALLTGVGVIGVLVARRRPDGDDPAAVPAGSGLWTPPPFRAEATMRGMLIEAELQEMIAEQRAAMLLGPAEEAEPELR